MNVCSALKSIVALGGNWNRESDWAWVGDCGHPLPDSRGSIAGVRLVRRCT